MKRFWMCILILCLLSIDLKAEITILRFNFLPTFRLANTSVIQSNLASDTQVIQILEFTMNQFSIQIDTSATGNVIGLLADLSSLIEPSLTTPALTYPNPFRFANGAQIGYGLSKAMDVEIHIYDMFANRIFKTIIPAGSPGGLGQPFYNKLTFNESTIGVKLPSGVYFFLIINNKKVLGKGKMMVMP